MNVGAVKQAFLDDRHCGDDFGYWGDDSSTLLCIVDGLGHGREAEAAANAAVGYVAGHRGESLRDILTGCDLEIRHTRGVAMGLARVDRATGQAEYAGIGNTRARVFTPRNLRTFTMNSTYGIVGAGLRKVVPESHKIRPGDIVIMYTDGLKEMIDISVYEPSLFGELQLLSEKILADWSRRADDAAVLVFRNGD